MAARGTTYVKNFRNQGRVNDQGVLGRLRPPYVTAFMISRVSVVQKARVAWNTIRPEKRAAPPAMAPTARMALGTVQLTSRTDVFANRVGGYLGHILSHTFDAALPC